MIVKHKHFHGGTQTVDGTVYQISPQGFADMSPEHAAMMTANPVFGWEPWKTPAPAAAPTPPPAPAVVAKEPEPPAVIVPPAPEPAAEPPVEEVKEAKAKVVSEEKPQQETAPRRKHGWREKE